jgi:glycosyltransferase involved in cell wall biosynthesis
MNETLFFSIIVPAHNEERYIEKTLRSLVDLEYPKESYEVIVIENGSSDRTLEKASAFASENIRIVKMKGLGVSAARNRGISEANEKADWLLFLDADTQLLPEFLKEFNACISQVVDADSYVVGTTTITPDISTATSRLWFGFYNMSHRLTKSSCSFFFAKRSALESTRFDESMHLMEDLRFTSSMRSKGKFLFMHTTHVVTSTRRFTTDGWFTLFFLYLFVGLLPVRLQRHFMYRAVR